MKRSNRFSTIELGGMIQIFHARYQGRAFTPHWHEEYAVGLIVDGVESFEYRGSIHRAVSQEIVLMNAGEVHTGESFDHRGFAFQTLYVPATTFEEVGATRDAVDSAFHFASAVSRDADLTRLLGRFHETVACNTGTLGQQTHLLDALVTLLERSGAWSPRQVGHPGSRQLSNARELLHAGLFEDVSLDDLAEAAEVSKYHLLRAFRKAYGLPPHAYQLQHRIFAAKQHLEQGLPVAETALACGFFDQSHLSRTFRSYVGTTPALYAAQFRTRRHSR